MICGSKQIIPSCTQFPYNVNEFLVSGTTEILSRDEGSLINEARPN